jgi:hypothetical protein
MTTVCRRTHQRLANLANRDNLARELSRQYAMAYDMPSSIASAVLSFMNQPMDVNYAKFCAESNGCVGGFWKQLHGVGVAI